MRECVNYPKGSSFVALCVGFLEAITYQYLWSEKMAKIEKNQVVQALDFLIKTRKPPTENGFYIAQIQEVLNNRMGVYPAWLPDLTLVLNTLKKEGVVIYSSTPKAEFWKLKES